MEQAEIAQSFARLAAVLAALRDEAVDQVGIVGGWGAVKCLDETDLASVLASAALVDRDDGLLLLGLLDKCISTDDEAERLDPVCDVEGAHWESYGVAVAWASVTGAPAHGRGVVSTTHANRIGLCAVTRDGLKVDIAFVVDADDATLLWRSLFALEDVREAEFFGLAVRAFPDLEFAPGLSFARFEGGYGAVREDVVRHLSALNDDWTSAYESENGRAGAITTRIGISVSRESHATRASDKLMKLRDVAYNAEVYRCEWHSKLEPHRNRIHFHPGDATLRGPLIGIFCEHLAT